MAETVCLNVSSVKSLYIQNQHLFSSEEKNASKKVGKKKPRKQRKIRHHGARDKYILFLETFESRKQDSSHCEDVTHLQNQSESSLLDILLLCKRRNK